MTSEPSWIRVVVVGDGREGGQSEVSLARATVHMGVHEVRDGKYDGDDEIDGWPDCSLQLHVYGTIGGNLGLSVRPQSERPTYIGKISAASSRPNHRCCYLWPLAGLDLYAAP
jgi:hypothetical protein